MSFRVTFGGKPLARVPYPRYPSLPLAVAAAKVAYATAPSHIQIFNDNGQVLTKAGGEGWTYVDGIKPSSWAAGELTISEYFALVRGLNQQDNDDAEGPAPVDDAPYLEVNTDGYAAVYVDFDADGNPAPYTPAPGAWQFRVGTEGAFDEPDAPNRNLGPLPVNTVIQAQDGAGELPTLTAILLPDNFAYPVSLAWWGSDTVGESFAVPSETFDGDPLGSPVLVIHDTDGPIEYGETAGSKFGPVDYDSRHLGPWAGYSDARTSSMLIARPLTPLPDDDGVSPGWFYRRVELTYSASQRIASMTADGDGGMFTSVHTYNADPALIGNVTISTSYGMVTVPTWVDAMGTDTSGADESGNVDGWPAGCGSDPGGGIGREVWPDGAHYEFAPPGGGAVERIVDARFDFKRWSAQGWLQAIYVQRGIDGQEWEYRSNKTPVSVNIAAYRQYPMPPTHFVPKATTCFSGASGGLGWTDFTDPLGDKHGSGWAVITPFDAYGGIGAYQPGDTLSYGFPAVQGAVSYHIFVKRQGTQYPIQQLPINDDTPADGPCQQGEDGPQDQWVARCVNNPDPLGYLLTHGVAMAGSCTSIQEFLGAGAVDSSQLGAADCAVIEADGYPILGGVNNGGSVPYDCDTVVYRDNTGAQQPDAVTGPRPATVAYFAPAWAASCVMAPAHGTPLDATCNDIAGAQAGSGSVASPQPTPPIPSVKLTTGKMLYWWVSNASQPLPEFLQAEVIDDFIPSGAITPENLRQAYFLLYADQTAAQEKRGFGVIGFRGSVPDGEGDVTYTDPVYAKGPYTAYINYDVDLTGYKTLADIATALAGKTGYKGAQIADEDAPLGTFDPRGSSAGDDRGTNPDFLVVMYKRPQKLA